MCYATFKKVIIYTALLVVGARTINSYDPKSNLTVGTSTKLFCTCAYTRISSFSYLHFTCRKRLTPSGSASIQMAFLATPACWAKSSNSALVR